MAAAQPADIAPDVRAVILTTFGRPGDLRRAMECGAMGFASSAMQMLGAHSRAEAVKVAEDKGWL